MQGVMPLSRIKESLEHLTVDGSSGLAVDPAFISVIQVFFEPGPPEVDGCCRDERGRGQCSFGLNNGNVNKLAAALPRLETLLLGLRCFENTCATTVACLPPISVHCPQLMESEIHFNTTNIVDDFWNIAKPATGHRSKLRILSVPQTLLTIGRRERLEAFDGLEDILQSRNHERAI